MHDDFKFDLGETDDIKILLNQDFTAEVLDAHGKKTGEKADWNMIYDQAMYVTLPSRKMMLMANFRYSVDPRVPESDYHLLVSGAYQMFTSKCSETMVGVVVHDDSGRDVQCYIGY